MDTFIEVGRDGTTPVRVFHRTARRKWTHPADKAARAACLACTDGRIPPDIKRGEGRSIR